MTTTPSTYAQPRVLTQAQAKHVTGGNTGVNRIGCWRIGGTWTSYGGSGIRDWLNNGVCAK